MLFAKLISKARRFALVSATAALCACFAQTALASEILDAAPLEPIGINIVGSGLHQDFNARAQIIKHYDVIMPAGAGKFEIQSEYGLADFPAREIYDQAVADFQQMSAAAALKMGYDTADAQKIMYADFNSDYSAWVITGLIKLTEYDKGVSYAACVINGSSRDIAFSLLNGAVGSTEAAYSKYVKNHDAVLRSYLQTGEPKNSGTPQNYHEPEMGAAFLHNGQVAFFTLKRTVNSGDTLTASDFIDVAEGSNIVSVGFVEYPNFRAVGKHDVILRVSYGDGEQKEATTQLTVLESAPEPEPEPEPEGPQPDPNDTTPPVFATILNLYAKAGTEIDYFNGVSATDDSGSVEVTVDSSSVDESKTGRYHITYTATDPSGNTATANAILALSSIAPETCYAQADKIIANNASGNLSQYEKAKRLYNWVINNVRYTDGSAHTSPIDGAYTAFTRGRGDCYIFYSAVEVLFTRAGIRNMMVTRVGGRAPHYWSIVNVGDGWYHVDATPYSGGAPRVRFMFSESQARAYSARYSSMSYNYDKSLYPAVEP